MLKDQCGSCGEWYAMKMDDTCVYLYESDYQFNHVQTVCGHCDSVAMMFGFDYYGQAIGHGYPLAMTDEAPWPVKHLWAQLNDPDNLPEAPPEYDQPTEEFGAIKPTEELTPRQERLIEDLGHLLEDTPDDLLMSIFEAPPPKTNLPQRWI